MNSLPIFAAPEAQHPGLRFFYMDFGKLDSVDKVDFSLPPEPPQNGLLLRHLPPAVSKTLYLGPTGYNMKPWVGKWYPFGAKEKDFLKHYGKQFNSIEHNTTHYRIPDRDTVVRWHEETPEDFKFCPKIPQSISHSKDLGLSGPEIPIFCHAVAGLQEKLGCCFMQLPPLFSPKDLPILKRFLEHFPTEIPLAIEARHPLFFNYNVEAEIFFNLLTQFRVTTVITDVAGRRDVCHMRLSTEKVLIRFVGNRLHPTDYSRVQEWAQRLSAWFEGGLHEAYFFTHEPDNLLAPELAAYCNATFSEAIPGISLRGPKEVPGQQGSLF